MNDTEKSLEKWNQARRQREAELERRAAHSVLAQARLDARQILQEAELKAQQITDTALMNARAKAKQIVRDAVKEASLIIKDGKTAAKVARLAAINPNLDQRVKQEIEQEAGRERLRAAANELYEYGVKKRRQKQNA